MSKFNYIICFLFFFGFLKITETDAMPKIIVNPGTTLVDGTSFPYSQLQPGDSLFFRGGARNYLLIRNFTGSAQKAIVFINMDGPVTFNTDWYYGIVLQNCRYVRLTGTGDPNYFYGFMIERVKGGAGISVGSLTSDFEIDHIYISNVSIAGIYAKTDPDCSFNSTRDKFIQLNTLIHDNYISSTGNEGMYIGSSFYSGETIKCNGKDTVVYPSLLKGVRVYNNIVNHAGWDGIQVGSAYNDCRIYNNLVMYDSQAEVNYQMSGILVGGGSQCDVYNNYIYKGKGDGIESLGLAGYRIFNNIIVDAGRSYQPGDPGKMKYGIYVSDVSTRPGLSFSILFNDIINPKSYGIKFCSVLSKDNLIASNAIISPGQGQNGYIQITSPACEVKVKNNYTAMSAGGAGFADSSYMLKKGSPLIDAGFSDNRNVVFDFYNHPRPAGATFDIGINEYNPNYPSMEEHKNDNGLTEKETENTTLTVEAVSFPDPARSRLTIRYSIDTTADVSVHVYSMQGEKVFYHEEDGLQAGPHDMILDVSSFPEGIYLFTLKANRKTFTGKFYKTK